MRWCSVPWRLQIYMLEGATIRGISLSNEDHKCRLGGANETHHFNECRGDRTRHIESLKILHWSRQYLWMESLFDGWLYDCIIVWSKNFSFCCIEMRKQKRGQSKVFVMMIGRKRCFCNKWSYQLRKLRLRSSLIPSFIAAMEIYVFCAWCWSRGRSFERAPNSVRGAKRWWKEKAELWTKEGKNQSTVRLCSSSEEGILVSSWRTRIPLQMLSRAA